MNTLDLCVVHDSKWRGLGISKIRAMKFSELVRDYTYSHIRGEMQQIYDNANQVGLICPTIYLNPLYFKWQDDNRFLKIDPYLGEYQIGYFHGQRWSRALSDYEKLADFLFARLSNRCCA